MRILLRLGMGCLLAGGLMAQRGGAGHSGGGGFHGGGAVGGGFRGGGSRGGAGGYGFRGGTYGRGFNYGGGRRFYGGLGYFPGYYGLGYSSPYFGYWDDPSYFDSPYVSSYPAYSAPVEYNPSPNVTVIYPAMPNPQPVYSPPPQPVMLNYDSYGQEVRPQASSGGASSGSPIYLIATKDQTIHAAAAYWVDGRTLHYLTLQHDEKQVSLDLVDRGFSQQLNRERRVAFQLPQ